MRQMADGSKNGVVFFHAQLMDHGTALLPRVGNAFDLLGVFCGNGVRTTFLPTYKSGYCCIRAVSFAPCNRMAGNKLRNLVAQRTRVPQAATSPLILPASVTTVCGCNHGLIAERILSVCATGAASRTRSASRNALLDRSTDAIDQPSSFARVSDACRAADTDDLLHCTGLAQGSSKRSADQPYTRR
jgi:hypothetical protein